MRRLLARALFAIAAVGLTLGAVLSTASENLFDAKAFASVSAQSLSDPRVEAYAADRVTDAVLDTSPDLTPVRPFVLAISKLIVSSEAFRAVLRASAESTHRALFAEGTRRVVLSVPDAGVLLRSALERASPHLVEKIPRQLEALVLSLESSPVSKWLSLAWALREDLQSLAQALLILSPALLLLALWLIGDPRRGFVGAGIALCAAALGLFVLPLLVRAGVPAFVESPLAAGAAQGLLDAFLAPLGGWAVLLLGPGLLLMAAGTSLMAAFDPLQALRIGGQRAIVVPTTRSGRLLYGLALLAFGVMTVRAPALVGQAAIVILGLGVALLGARLLLGLVLQSVENSQSAIGVGEAGLSLLKTAALVALIIAVAGVWIALLRPEPAHTPSMIEACNGHDVLCDRRIEAVAFPGTHNSMSNVATADWMFPQQQASIATQLRDGVRALLIDVHYGFPGGSRIKTDLSELRPSEDAITAALGQEGVDAALRIRNRLVGVDEGRRGLYLCHGLCELGATELGTTLRAIRDFLVRQPGEVLLIVVEDYVSPRDLADEIERSGLAARVYRGPSGTRWPTLDDLVESGANVVFFLESGREGVEWLRPAFEFMQETPYTFRSPEDFNCSPNRGGTTPGLFQVNHWIETTPTPLPSNAEIVNARDTLLGRARQCEKERGLLPNILAVDFYRSGDLFGVVDTLNGVADHSGQ